MAANKDLPFLASALKAPRISQSWARLADQARESGWSHEEYLAAVLETEVNARNHSGAALRVKAAGFPAIKTLDEFTLTHRPGISKDHLAKLAFGKYLTDHDNVIFLGRQEPGKHTSPSPSVSSPVTAVSVSCLTRPLGGWADSNTLTKQEPSTKSSPVLADTD